MTTTEETKPTSAAAPAPVPAVAATPAPPAPRHIPGLNSKPVLEKKPTRSRAKKTKAAGGTPVEPTDVAAAVEADGVKTTATAPEELSPALIAPTDELDELEEKKTVSAVEAVNKRIRAATKKIQRIVTYEEKTEALNADQQKAIASKPAAEATLKELQELLVILKADEAEDDARLARLKSVESKRHTRAVEDAKASAKAESQNDLILLFQFFHLHSLYNAPEGFAPAALPAAIANATGTEVAAVRMLFDAFSNGPLLGGHGDAVERLSKIASSSSEQVHPDIPVTYGRVKELVAGLSSPPAEAPLTSSSLPAQANDSVVALVDGTTEATPSFLQESELTSDIPSSTPAEHVPVQDWAESVAPASEVPAAAPTNGHAEVPAAAEPKVAAPATTGNGWGDIPPPAAAGASIDWSEDHSGELPPLEGLGGATATNGPPPAVAAVDDGFQSVNNNRGRRGGPPRGGFRGRGGNFRGRGGGPREGGERPEGWTPRPPREGGERRGGYQGQGGNGFDGPRPRGRGGFRGGPRGGGSGSGNASPAGGESPAPATPTAEKW